jgi:hypothetical protein
MNTDKDNADDTAGALNRKPRVLTAEARSTPRDSDGENADDIDC